MISPGQIGRFLGVWFRRQMPKTLFGRSLLIIVLPVAIMQVAVTYVFFDAHWQDDDHQRAPEQGLGHLPPEPDADQPPEAPQGFHQSGARR